MRTRGHVRLHCILRQQHCGGGESWSSLVLLTWHLYWRSYSSDACKWQLPWAKAVKR